jgi:hypothetical protein
MRLYDGVSGVQQTSFSPIQASAAAYGTVTPEPSTFALLGVGAASLLAYAWRRQRAR